MTDFFYVDTPDAVKLDTLLRHVMPVVNNVPYELALDVVRQSYTEFARKSCLLAAQQYIDIQKDVIDYELIAPTGYEVYAIRVAGIGPSELYNISPNYWYTCGRRRFQMIGNRQLILGDTPSKDESGVFSMVYTVLPTECASTIPREVSVPFGKCIADGALAEVLTYKSKPWFDPNLAQSKKRDFYRGIQTAANLNLMNRQNNNMTARAPRWV